MLPNLASGPQNQPMEKVAVSNLVSWTCVSWDDAAEIVELSAELSIVLLSFSSASWLDGPNEQSRVPSTNPMRAIQTMKTGGMGGEIGFELSLSTISDSSFCLSVVNVHSLNHRTVALHQRALHPEACEMPALSSF